MKTVSADRDFAAEWESLVSKAKESKRELAPNEKTRNEFCKETGLSIDEADKFFSRLIKEGKAETFYMSIDGHKQKIIRLLT